MVVPSILGSRLPIAVGHITFGISIRGFPSELLSTKKLLYSCVPTEGGFYGTEMLFLSSSVPVLPLHAITPKVQDS